MTGTEEFTDITGMFASSEEMIALCKGTVYGYLRVSTAAQSHERQVDAMKELGVKEENMFFDKQSGKDFKRPAYQKLMDRLQEGDLLVIKSLDRLGRNAMEAKEQWWILTKEKKVSIVVIDTPILNAGKELGPLGQAVSDIIFTIFSLISDFDRHSIWQRMHEGLMVAMRERGVKPGRKPLPVPEEFHTIREDIEAGKISQRAAAQKIGVDRKTLKKWLDQAKEKDANIKEIQQPEFENGTDIEKNKRGKAITICEAAENFDERKIQYMAEQAEHEDKDCRNSGGKNKKNEENTEQDKMKTGTTKEMRIREKEQL